MAILQSLAREHETKGKLPRYPDPPPFPQKILEAYPDLKQWQKEFKKWLAEYTEMIIKAR